MQEPKPDNSKPIFSATTRTSEASIISPALSASGKEKANPKNLTKEFFTKISVFLEVSANRFSGSSETKHKCAAVD